MCQGGWKEDYRRGWKIEQLSHIENGSKVPLLFLFAIS